MGDMEQEVIDQQENNEENQELENQENDNQELDLNEEDTIALKKLWIDPQKATVTDLINLAKRTIKAEQVKIAEKKEAKQTKETKSDDLEMRLFFIENPEFKEDKEWILEVLKIHPSLTPQEAQILYKANKPKQSEDKKNDFIWGWYKPKPKSLAELSDEDAMKLNPQDFLKRLKLRWELK